MSIATTAYWFFRRWMHERDGGTCGICGAPVDLAKMDIDHIVQLTDGGSDDPSNLRVTHPSCNRRRPRVQGIRRRFEIQLVTLIALKEWAMQENFELESFVVHLLKRALVEWRPTPSPPTP